MNYRKLLKYHSWLGLFAGLFLILMGVSGAILVFHSEIDQELFEDYTTVEHAERTFITKGIETVQENYPGWDIRLFHFKPNEALVFDVRKERKRWYVFVHPTAGEILHELNSENHFTAWLLKLHYSLHAGTTGRILVLIFGILFFLSLITGIILYRDSIIDTLLFRIPIFNKNRRAFYSSLHRSIGVWSLLFNLILAITGIILAYAVALAGVNSLPAPETPLVTAPVSEVLEKLTTKHPDFSPTYIRLPKTPESNISIYGIFDEDQVFFSEFYNNIQVDYKTGEVLNISRISDAPFLTKLNSMVAPLHFGFGGTWIKILYCFIGLTGPFLSVSGFVIWWRRIKKKRKKKKKKSLKKIF